VSWPRRIAIAAVAVVVIVLLGAGALLVVGHQRSQSKIDDVAARACKYPTDAAGRRYVSEQAAKTGVNYVQTLEAMYHRCPNRGIATIRKRRRPRSAPPVVIGHRHTTTTRGSGERDDGEDDGGD
jgi:hypothetical protein